MNKRFRVLFLIAQGFEDLEFFVPWMRLQEERFEVLAAAEKAGEEIVGKGGLSVTPQLGIDNLTQDDFDAIVIPGGWAPDKLRRSAAVKKLVGEADRMGKPLGLICHGGLVGISAGIVSGKPVTGSEGIKDDLLNAGAIWRDVPALRHENHVWGRVVADIPDFCRELVCLLREAKRA